MWLFKPKRNGAGEEQRLRYTEKPLLVFFEAFVLEIIGELPTERQAKLSAFPLHQSLKTQATEWRAAVRESLHLSATIDTAILDLWYTNRASLASEGTPLDPEEFAREFVDHYLAADSQVDVWPGDALQQAKRRIAKHQSSAGEV